MNKELTFGAFVRQRRHELALTQEELGRQAGCAAITLRKIEAGDLRVSDQIAERLAIALGIPAEERDEFFLMARAVQPAEIVRPRRQVGACPYRGLAAFQEADAPFYFGREGFVDELEHSLRTRRLVAVIVGSSGSGKSSVVFAGLLPRLRQAGGYQFAIFRPGAQPFYSLADALVSLLEPELSKTDHLTETGKLADQLLRDKEVHLAQVIEHLRKDSPGMRQVLLVVDQFEELYTLCADAGLQTAFIDELLATLEASRRTRGGLAIILVTMRADFMGQALAYRPFADALQEASFLMGPMSRAELHRAIEKPAELQGAAFEPGLVERILDDVGEQPGNLPLLEFTLTQLWERQTDGWLTHTDYEAMGCVEGALAAYADQVYDSLDADEQERARRVLVQLVQPGEGTEDTRRMATRAELGDESWALVQHLADQRLVVTGQDAQGRETAEVVHEALIQKWGRFKEWMDADRAFRAWQERLRGNLRQWQESGQDEGALLGGAPLAVAQGWLAERGGDISPAEAGYIQASLELQTRRQRERQRRRQWTFAGLATGLVIALLLAGFAFYQRQNSQRQAAILLAGQAETELANGYHDRAVLLALQALQNNPYTWQAERALGQAVTYSRAKQVYAGHTGSVTGLAWSPDGKQVASTGSDNSLRIWDPVTGQTLQLIDLPQGITGNKLDMGLAVRWTPDGRRLVTLTGDRFTFGSQDFHLIVWDAASGGKVSNIELPNKAEPVSGEEISTITRFPTGSAIDIDAASGRLATLGGDNTAIIWDETYQTPDLTLSGHTDAVNSVAWSPDGKQLVTASQDGTAMIWDAGTGTTLQTLKGHAGRVTLALWSPDGSQVATAGDDGTARLWDAKSGQPIRTIETGAGIVWTLAWSPDGARLVTGQDDASLRIWDANGGKQLETLRGHQGIVSDLKWSPADDRLVSADAIGSARVWNAAPSTALVALPYKNANGQMDISHDGRYLAMPAGNPNVTSSTPFEAPSLSIWDLTTGKRVVEQVSKDPNLFWFWVAYSPDDRMLLVVGQDAPWPDVSAAQTAYVLDAWSGEAIKSFNTGSDAWIKFVGWSPDASQVATALSNGEFIIWDYQTGEQIVRLRDNDRNIIVGGVVWSRDGSRFATPGDYGVVNIWDASNWKVLFKLIGHSKTTYVNPPLWSPDGSRILTGAGNEDTGTDDNTARIWDAATGKQLLVLSGHTRQIGSVDWSPDGSRVVTAGADGTTRIWDASTGAELLSLTTTPIYFSYVRWSPDGQHLVTGGFNDPPRIWRVWQSTEELVDYARECCVIRSLTEAERQQYGLP